MSNVLLIVLAGFLMAGNRALSQSLADTIWEGTQWISSINMVSLKPNGSQDFPSLRGVRFNLPLEIWFWDNKNFGVVFRNDRWGFEGRRKGEYSGYRESTSPGEIASVYTYRLQNGTGSFSSRRSWDYFGFNRYQGRLKLNPGGKTLTTDRITYTPPGFFKKTESAGFPFKVVSPLPKFDSTVWKRTNRKPSIAKNQPGYLKD